MLTYLNEELQAKERCAYFKRVKIADTNEEDRRCTGLQLYAETRNGNSKCVFCLKEYLPSKCNSVTNIDSRMALLRKYAKCFICLFTVGSYYQKLFIKLPLDFLTNDITFLFVTNNATMDNAKTKKRSTTKKKAV